MKRSYVLNLITEVLENITYSNLAEKYADQVLSVLEKENLIKKPVVVKEWQCELGFEEVEEWEEE